MSCRWVSAASDARHFKPFKINGLPRQKAGGPFFLRRNAATPTTNYVTFLNLSRLEAAMATKLFDSSIVGTAEQALDFIGNILESSTEYSVIGKDLNGQILLWNEC